MAYLLFHNNLLLMLFSFLFSNSTIRRLRECKWSRD